MQIVLIGYGKMGNAIERLATHAGHEIIGIIDIDTSVAERKAILTKGEIAIEFSHPTAAFDNIIEALNHNIPVVSGTTGWLDRFEQVRSLVNEKKGAFFYASNYSIGVNIMFAINEKLAAIMNRYPSYDVEIDETHHIHKKDAPSGTALTLTCGVIDQLERKDRWSLTESKNEVVRLNAFREGEVFGKHIVRYKSKIDTIELMHDAHSRDGFAQGAIVAAEWLLGRKGIFSMRDLMEL